MGWIRWTGKALELSGKLIQTKSFEEWADDQGRSILEKVSVQEGGYIFGLFKKQRARRAIWTDLEQTIESKVLKVSIQNTISKFPSLLSKVSEKCPRYNKDNLYLVPRFLLNDCALLMLNHDLGQSEELRKLKGEDALRQFFFGELVQQLDDEFSAAASKAYPKRPINIPYGWVVGFEQAYEWVESRESGHYYVYRSYFYAKKGEAIGSEKTKSAGDELAKCEDWLGRISASDRAKLVADLPTCDDELVPTNV
jgi:hypothetical protein